MNFSLPTFWLSLFAGLTFIWLLTRLIRQNLPHRWLLAALSLTLLGLESALTLAVFLSVFSVTYLALRWLARQKKLPPLFIALVVVLQFLPLLFFKYGNFLTSQVFSEAPDLLRDLIIPVGLSFYTFQMVGLLVDTVKDHLPLPSFLDCLNFASFFPQIVAGPIERRSDLLPQMERFRFQLDWDSIERGVRWVILGLFMKLTLAENIAAESAAVTIDPGNPFLVWLECLFFSFRIYNDFAGYSFIAYGIATALGVKLTLNFLSPYWTTNFRDFWRHWHVSLSQWFRDYLYIPLGGNRGSSFKVYRNLMITMLLGGLWHGAGWTFIVWGGLHGIILCIYRALGDKFTLPKLWGRVVATFFFFHLICLTWLFFRADSFDQAWEMLRLILTQQEMTSLSRYGLGMIAFFCTPLMVYEVWLNKSGSLRRLETVRWGWRAAAYCYIVFMLIVFPPPVFGQFIYFQF